MNPIAQAALARARRTLVCRPTSSRKAWSEIDAQRLAELYPDTPMPELTRIFGRPDYAIYRKAAQLRLKRSDTYLASEHAGRLRAGDDRGTAHQFQKGHKSWNHGLRGLPSRGRAPETQFKKGARPPNWLPLGSIRTSQDGYLQRKIKDTGYPPRDWVGLHILLWEEHNGPIPSGHCVCFLDGNKQRVELDNLELITRAERMRRNTIHRYPPELKKTIHLLGSLKRAIKEATNEK